jgi:membrane-associated phospholipid phosphatase
VPVYALAKAMAVSRIYAGVHYPTDIAAGAAFGTAVAELLDTR